MRPVLANTLTRKLFKIVWFPKGVILGCAVQKSRDTPGKKLTNVEDKNFCHTNVSSEEGDSRKARNVGMASGACLEAGCITGT